MARLKASGYRLALLSALLGFHVGCQSVPDPGLQLQIGPDWRIQSGQAIWLPRPEGPELAGELIFASGPGGECYLEFTKTPLTLVTVMRDRDRWSFKSPEGKRTYSGRGKPPSQIAWLYLRQALTGEKLPEALRFEQTPDGNWRLHNTKTGETLKGFLSP
jgi:hypothetical protein